MKQISVSDVLASANAAMVSPDFDVTGVGAGPIVERWPQVGRWSGRGSCRYRPCR